MGTDVANQGAASRLWLIPAFVVIASGTTLMAARHYASEPDDPEGWLAGVAFGAPALMAGILALLAILRGYPTVVVGASIAVIPISLVSVILWPLMVPVTLLLAFGLQRISRPAAGEIVIGGLIVVGLISAFVLLLVHEDPVTWQSADGKRGGGSSDIITTVEASASLTIVAAVGLVAGATMLRRHS